MLVQRPDQGRIAVGEQSRVARRFIAAGLAFGCGSRNGSLYHPGGGCGYTRRMDLAARNGSVYRIAEWSLESAVERDDPFNQVTVDLLVTDPSGREQSIPAFWAGGREWRARYAPARAGRHLVNSRCSDVGGRRAPRRRRRVARGRGGRGIQPPAAPRADRGRCRLPPPWSTPTAPRSCGSPTPGGWGCVGACAGPTSFIS